MSDVTIELILAPDEDDVDETDGTGLTSEAFDNLSEALIRLGYDFVSGPTRV